MNDLQKDYKVPTYNRRDIILGIIGAIAMVGFIIYGVLAMFDRTDNRGFHGIIVEKDFLPAAETQITIGTGGVTSRDLKGQYRLTVRVETRDTDYFVWVDENAFRRYDVGDRYFFIRPPADTAGTAVPESQDNPNDIVESVTNGEEIAQPQETELPPNGSR